MISVVLLSIYLALLCYQIYNYCFYKPPNFPPGPPRIPLVGSYLFLLLIDRKNIHKAVLKLCKWYKTKHLGLYIGTTPTIVTNTMEGVRDLLFNQAFDGRPDLFISRMRDVGHHENRGIFFTENFVWKEQRRFTLRHLRDYGFGRRFDALEAEMNDEILSFIDIVKNGPKYEHERKFFDQNSNVLLPLAIFPCIGNCLLQIFFNQRLTREEQRDLYEAAENGLLFQRTGDDYGLMLSQIPWIRYFIPKASGFVDLKKANRFLHKFMRGLVDRYIESYKENLERNFIDLYIEEMKKAETSEERGFIYDQLILTCLDFFFPALTAVGQQIVFLIQFSLQNPKVKEKIQHEIDEVVGQGRLPSLDDRIHMPYTEASIRECLRFETLVPSGIPHKATHSTKFLDYDVPQGTFMLTGLYAFHNDPKQWGDPFTFRPERFFDMRGQLSLKKDVTLPFGAGKRLCAGETFARNALFLMTATIFQNFNFELPKDDMTIEKLIEQNETGLIRTSTNFWMKFSSR